MTTSLTFPDPQQQSGGFDRRKILTRRGSTRRLRRNDEDGFCRLRGAAWPDRRADHGIAAPAARPAFRRPISGCSPGVMKKPKVSFGPTGFPAFAGTMAVERVATGFRWAEGPVYFAAGR